MVTEMSESKNLLNSKSELSSEEKFEILVFDVLYNSAVAQPPLIPDKSQIVLVDKIRIAALNESSSDGSDSSSSEALTKEAKEAEVFGWYNKALVLQRQGNIFDSESTFLQIIDHPFLDEAKELIENEVEGAIHPGLALLYSVHKNLAGIALSRQDEKTALQHYLEAVKIDESEVTVWFKIGKIAVNEHNYSLAKLAFEQGLVCNPNHWPCLDRIVTITYAYNNMWNCLEYIAKSLELDSSYGKGLAIRDQIFKEQPELKSMSKRLFSLCDPVVERNKCEKKEAEEYIKEAINIRDKRRELAKPQPPPVIKLPEKIDKYTWKRVGECLVSLINYALEPNRSVSLCLPIDMSDYENVLEQPMETDVPKKEVSDKEDTKMESNTIKQDKVESACSVTSKADAENKSLETKEPKDIEKPGPDETTAIETKPDLDTSFTESSQDSDAEMTELTEQSSSESVVILDLEQDVDSQKSANTVSNGPAAEVKTSSSDSQVSSSTNVVATSLPSSQLTEAGTTSQVTTVDSEAADSQSSQKIETDDPMSSQVKISSSQSSFKEDSKVSSQMESQPVSQVSDVEMTASNILAQVAAKVAADSSVTTPADSQQSSQMSTTQESSNTQTTNQDNVDSDCVVVEVSTENQSIFPKAAEKTDAEISSSANKSSSQQKPKTSSILANMIVGDFLPAEDVVQDFDYGSLFKDNEAKPGTPTSRNDLNKKRKRLYLDDRYGNKRRSARVKHTKDQKQEESVNFQELLQKFLPSSLVQNDEEDDEEMRSDETESEQETNKKDVVVKTEDVEYLKTTEDKDVREFIKSCIKNGGIVHLCIKYLITLAHQDHKIWQEEVHKSFLDVFKTLRPITSFPDLFSESIPIDMKYDFSKIGLVGCELLLDEYVRINGSLEKDVLSRDEIEDIFSRYLREDLWYILFCIGFPTVIQDSPSYCIRVHWLRGRFYLLQGDIEQAVVCFEQVLYYLKELEEKESKLFIKLQNCHSDQLITPEKVTNRKDNVQRSHSLGQTQKLFESESYDKVIDTLLKTFEESRNKVPQSSVAPSERHSQIKLLQKALFKDGDMQKCILWGEVCYSEALHYYRKAATPTQREEWAKTMVEVLNSLNKAFEKDVTASKGLPSFNKIRFSENLIKIIETMMDVSPNVTEMPVGTVIPWLLLYRLIHHEEVKLHSMIASQSKDQADVLEGAISTSLMLLSVAHEYLGRHSWCTKNNGAVLLLFLKVLRKERNKSKLSASLKEELDVAFEQCIYCLYGHPNKKSKSRRLHDHNSPPISLTWTRAQAVFEYYKPSTVPEFDSYKTSTVSTELEGLLRRVFVLVPEELGGAGKVDTVVKYIDGDVNTPPSFETDNLVLKELYYLLADYYFKNKETSKAIRFYQCDLCVNPKRLDSWAGTALARMSQLEQKLNSMELKLDMPIHKKAIAALRCFKRAVEINDTTRTLWIEYGSLAYQLHSHSSRQLKLKDWFSLDQELLQIVNDMKPEMLQIARNCYWKASECEADGSEEEWLHHYMMGKIKEKKRAHPKDYLEHYRQAAIYLHEDEAVYPKKIVFSHSPPHLAIEALEVFYRLHATILKHLIRDDGTHDYKLFEEYITEAANSPFAKGREKRQERRESTNEDSSSNSAYCFSKQKPVYHMTPQDHTYSKLMSSSSGSDTDNNSSSLVENPGSNKAGKESTESVEKPIKLEKQTTEPFVPSAAFDGAEGAGSEQPEKMDTSDNQFTKEVGGMSMETAKEAPSFYSEMSPKSETTVTDKTEKENISAKPDTDKSENPKMDNSKSDNINVDNSKSENSNVDDCKAENSNVDDSKSENQNVFVSECKKSAPKGDNSKSENSNKDETQCESAAASKTEEDMVIDLTESDEDLSKKTCLYPDQRVDLKTHSNTPKTDSERKIQDKPKDDAEAQVVDPEVKRKELISSCMKTLNMCLSRFPNHYKSVYRLAYAYTYSKNHKNLQFARDLLLGTNHWQKTDHMSSPGLFHERKTANFFQGIWKIPVQEIDRAGSFASHMNKAICLLLDILKELNDNRMLYNVHVQLLRVPDSGKKFLRDSERIYLWKQAYKNTIDVLMNKCDQLDKENNEEKRLSFLMDVYKVWHHGVHKINKLTELTNKLFIRTYRLARRDKVDNNIAVIEQASKFCQQRQNQTKLPQIPHRPALTLFKPQESQSDSSLFSPSKSDKESIFFSPPPKRVSGLSTCSSPVPNSPSTPSLSSSRYIATPETPTGSYLSSPVSSKSLLASNLGKSDTSNVKPQSHATGQLMSSKTTEQGDKGKSDGTSKSALKIAEPMKNILMQAVTNVKKDVKPSSTAVAPTKSLPLFSTKQSTASVEPSQKFMVSKGTVSLLNQSLAHAATTAKAQNKPIPKQIPIQASKKTSQVAQHQPNKSSGSISNVRRTSNQSSSQARSPVEEVETLIEAPVDAGDDFLIMSNPDELIQSFLGYHNL
ncbi:hypothetical protein LOTGIDRAFT_152594 [Lottia gigantea]|uniref:Calcineurin-binding protein cabin-1 MEF2-binding domain-containing protein n=1 Tax=Lottia gigantea TaxID=225164 RepID=V4C747_LOTGI|nr:hypothetical protein LOTGIDRAFT_152594 [Lottia gigantea]ESO97504.1 hypothetical protein LOTGIDRAFT_152594 [Lottia gigantea]